MSGSARRSLHGAALAAVLIALGWPGGLSAEPALAEPQAQLPQLPQPTLPPEPGLPTRGPQDILQGRVDQPTGFLLAGVPHVLVFDMPDLRNQGEVFGRIVAFLEKSGVPKARVLSVAEFQHWLESSDQRIELLTLGNNLEARNLARFYNMASFQNEALMPQERWLLDELLRFGVLQRGRRGWLPSEPPAIVLSLPGVSTVAACAACAVTQRSRQLIFEHEYGHALYFADVWLQQYTEWFWFNRTSLALRSRVLRFLGGRGYDTQQLSLVLNEFYAFLVHTEDALLFKPADWGLSATERDALRTSFNALLDIDF